MNAETAYWECKVMWQHKDTAWKAAKLQKCKGGKRTGTSL